jgi:hypothetical protein
VGEKLLGGAVRCAPGRIMMLNSSNRYMLRYLKAAQMMKKIIEENNVTVMVTITRYACAYEAIAEPDWWDKSKRYVYFMSVNFLGLSIPLTLAQ